MEAARVELAARPVRDEEAALDAVEHLAELDLVERVLADLHVVARVRRVEEEEGVLAVELLDQLGVVGVADLRSPEPIAMLLDAIDRPCLDALGVRVVALAPQLPVSEVREVQEPVELLDLAPRPRVLQRLERRRPPDPVLLAQGVELLVGERLHRLERSRDLRVRVAQHLDLGRLLLEEDGGAAGERLDIDPVRRNELGEPRGEPLLARGRSPDRLLDGRGGGRRDVGQQHLVVLRLLGLLEAVVRRDERHALAQALALVRAHAGRVPPALDVEALEELGGAVRPGAVGDEEAAVDAAQHLGEAPLVPVVVADLGLVAGVGRIEEEERVPGVELVDDVLVVGAADDDVFQPRRELLEPLDEPRLHAGVLVRHRAAPELVEREVREVGEAVKAVDLVLRLRLVELPEAIGVPDPGLALEALELLRRQALHEAERERDVRVAVGEDLDLGRLLRPEHLRAARERLDVDAMPGDGCDDALREVTLAGGRAPQRLLQIAVVLAPHEREERPGARQRVVDLGGSRRGGDVARRRHQRFAASP